MFKLKPPVTKDYILSKYSEEEIFERYLGRVTSKMFCSTLRQDKNPTCSFIRSSKGLFLKDWSGDFYGTCFDYVMRVYGCSFSECLRHIAEDFKLDVRKKPRVLSIKESTKVTIEVTWRKYTKQDIDYWREYGIDIPTLKKFKVGAVDLAIVNGALIYTHSPKDHCYAYWFSDTEMKLYFPKRTKYRFISNTLCLQGYDQLPERGDLVIVTKSNKDVMLLTRLGFSAVAPQAESCLLTEKEVEDLKRRFTRVITFFDFDKAGISGANKHKRKYGLPYIFLTNGRFRTCNYKAKDITDLFKRKRSLAFCQQQVISLIA